MRQKLTRTAIAIIVLLNCLLSGSSVFAQERTIIGKITSPDGSAVPGATVTEKGTTNTVVSDIAGTYAIRVSRPGVVLVFSSIGFLAQEAPVGKDANLSIQLLTNGKQLNEVVVTALGIKKEARRIGYAVQEVKGDDLVKAREPDVFNGLEGKVAGLTIGTSPELFGRPNIVNRGTKDVLIVVDGVPINSDTWNINADDIDNVSVLKGPNAAALYGFRGQNGAIVITTKKGSRDSKGWQVNFNSTDMVETSNTTLPKDQTEYGRGTAMQYSFGEGLDDHTQRLPTWGPKMEGQPVLQYNSPYDVTTGVRTPTPYLSVGKNNYKNFLSTGALATQNISLSSSGRNNDIRISYSHVYQKGTDPNTKINMDNLNINTDYDINERLKLSANLNLNVQYTPNIPDANYGPNSYVYMFNIYGNAAYDVRNLKNYYQAPMGVPGIRQYAENYGRSNNPYFMAQQWLRGHYKTDIYGYVKADYSITKELVATFRTQFTGWSMERTEDVPAGTILNQYLPWYYWGWYGDYREDRRNLLENNTDFLLSYNKKETDWNLSANAGASERSFRYSSSYGTTVDLAIPGVYSLNNSQTPALAYNWRSNMQVYSGYYSVDFGFRNYFNISNTGRVDKLSTLPSGSNTFYYPSVALSTNLVDYMHLPETISYLKLRASYAEVRGALTTAQAPSAYALSTGSSVGNLLGYGSEYYTSYDGPTYANQSAYSNSTYYNNQPSVSYSNTISNPKLKSYDVKSTEAGADFRLFHNRLGLDATYFRTVNGPQIYPLPVPSSTSYNYQNVNGITTLKQGWELTFNASPFKNPNGFSWETVVNWSTYKETLKEIYGSLTSLPINGNHNYTIGERLDDFYSSGFVRDGSGNVVWKGGGPLSASGNISQAESYLGHLNPDFTFGWNNRFSYKNVSLSFQIDGRVGGKIYDDVWYHAMNGGTAIESDQGALGAGRLGDWEAAKGNGGVIPSTYAGTYVGKGVVIASGTPTYSGGKITNLKDLTFAPNTTPITAQSYLSSALGSNFDEYYTISRTFVKLREVQLAYAFSQKLLHKTFVKSATIALVGRNLLYFAKRKDFDIDQYASGFNAADRSYAGTSSDVTLSSPTFRRFGFNLNVGF
jgi:TonB-linked SusC/RagA family outer membrane protein